MKWLLAVPLALILSGCLPVCLELGGNAPGGWGAYIKVCPPTDQAKNKAPAAKAAAGTDNGAKGATE